jgi:hypothetical protein
MNGFTSLSRFAESHLQRRPDWGVTSTESCACCQPMAIHEQLTKTTPSRPTFEEIAEAREWFAGDGKRTIAHLAANYPESYGVIMVLLAATEPPTEEEVCHAAMHYAEEHMAMYRETFGGNLGALLVAITNAFIRGARSVSGEVEP